MDRGEKDRLHEECAEMNSLRRPSSRWCHKWLSQSSAVEYGESNRVGGVVNYTLLSDRYNHRNINPLDAKLPPPGCSLIKEGGESGSYRNLYLFPRAKLTFCGIYKNGSTEWLKFLRFTLGAKDFQDEPHHKPDVQYFMFDKFSRKTQMEVLNDPSWTFAAIMRNPAERLLSLYLDKWDQSKS
ncbi:hypothetical protein ACHAWF_001686 [Thalassiosira exigua]